MTIGIYHDSAYNPRRVSWIIAACDENDQGEESPGSTGQGAS
ncbi:hypothetical protein PSBY109024_10555 [Pseudoalteromonas byunsanensis]